MGFFFQNSSTMRYLGVPEGQKLSFPVEKQHLGLICLVGFFTSVECTEHIQQYIFNSMNCECWAFCKSGLCHTLNFDSADVAFSIMWPCRIHQQQTVIREEPIQVSTASLIQLQEEYSVWALCFYRLLSLPGYLAVKLGQACRGRYFHLSCCLTYVGEFGVTDGSYKRALTVLSLLSGDNPWDCVMSCIGSWSSGCTECALTHNQKKHLSL